ncbi:NADP-dependent isocitrate dehydrogenase [Rickettsiales bacterium]|nr:NADP-dependent isocitrate dehydrogenase [Rickettsiales bacterium]
MSSDSENIQITVAYGNGVGPYVMEAALAVLRYTHVPVHIETVEIGELFYQRGYESGMSLEAWETIRRNNIFLKAPITVPDDKNYKSLNVMLRKTLGLYANVRKFTSYAPYIGQKYPDMDMVVIRENVEGIYAGTEHHQTHDAYQSLRLTTATGTRKIISYAFDYAARYGYKKITCMTKDSLMPMVDGLFCQIFDEYAKHYPDIKAEHMSIDEGAAKIASTPEEFGVVVTGNLYGDIISQIATEICGFGNILATQNIGDKYSLFEPVHGSRAEIEDDQTADPSAMIHAMTMMLVHLGHYRKADMVNNAWLKTIEDGIHTADIFTKGVSKEKVNTIEFTRALIERMTKLPKKLPPSEFVQSSNYQSQPINIKSDKSEKEKKLIGVDVFFDFEDGGLESLVDNLHKATEKTALKLQMVGTRGLKVWPDSRIFIWQDGDYWRGRFLPEGDEKKATHNDICQLLESLNKLNMDFIKTENLYMFGKEEAGFSLVYGE